MTKGSIPGWALAGALAVTSGDARAVEDPTGQVEERPLACIDTSSATWCLVVRWDIQTDDWSVVLERLDGGVSVSEPRIEFLPDR